MIHFDIEFFDVNDIRSLTVLALFDCNHFSTWVKFNVRSLFLPFCLYNVYFRFQTDVNSNKIWRWRKKFIPIMNTLRFFNYRVFLFMHWKQLNGTVIIAFNSLWQLHLNCHGSFPVEWFELSNKWISYGTFSSSSSGKLPLRESSTGQQHFC